MTLDEKIQLAENENIPVNMLEKLANDEDWSVRLVVAENKNTPAATLEILAKDPAVEILNRISELEDALTLEDREIYHQADFFDLDLEREIDQRAEWLQKHFAELEKPIISASDLKNAKAEKDVRDATAPKPEQKQKAQEQGLE